MRASPFFEGVRQIGLKLDSHEVKLPIFYYDGSAMTGMFPARLSVLRGFLPDPRFKPARIAPGVGLMTITCFEYVDTDIGPYNELAIAIPLNVPYHRPNLPLRALVDAQRTGQLHAFVHHLPVTTEIALVSGKRLWNYPKFVAEIEFSEIGGQRSCRLAEGREHILTMTSDRIRTSGASSNQVFSHLWHERQPQCSEFKLRSTAGGQTARRGTAQLELGREHPISLELRKALLSTKSLAAQWSEGLEGILYGPEHLMLQTLDDILGQTGAEPAKAVRDEAKADATSS